MLLKKNYNHLNNKIILKIVLILITFICLAFLRHILVDYLFLLINIEKTTENLIYKIVSLPIVDLITFIVIYIFYLKLKLKNEFLKLILLTALLFPILNEIDLFILYLLFGFDNSQICFIHYNNFEILKWFLPILILVISVSYFILKKIKEIRKNDIKLVFLVVIFFIIFNKVILRIFA